MNIDKKKIKMGIWYEDEHGNVYKPDGDEIDPHFDFEVTKHVCFPLEVNEKIFTSSGEYVLTCHTHIGGDGRLLVAMVNSGDYTLPEAMAVYANACERCANVLWYKYTNGEEGYPEFSDDWKKCNTVCEFCKYPEEQEETQ